MRMIRKRIFILISKIIMGLFYRRKYLTGRWFSGDEVVGWIWCWRNVFMQKIVGYNRKVPYPFSFRNIIGHPEKLCFHPDDLKNFQHSGCYFQCWRATITIGRGSCIAPNVGFITENHDVNELDRHETAQEIVLGERCWVGMNAVILPGVILGEKTIVGAGAVVTHSFPEGNCVVAGVPARKIKDI